MTIRVDLPTPERVLAVGAHPDDIEFGCGATLAKWADAGAAVHMFICTDGSKGTWDPDADLATLVATREEEQLLAAKVLGVAGSRFLRRVDGELANDEAARSALALAIRDLTPDVVTEPRSLAPLPPASRSSGGRPPRGARVRGRARPALLPRARLAAAPPATLLLFEPARVDHLERVYDHLDRKTDALLAHRSQWRSTMGIDDGDGERQRSSARPS